MTKWSHLYGGAFDPIPDEDELDGAVGDLLDELDDKGEVVTSPGTDEDDDEEEIEEEDR